MRNNVRVIMSIIAGLVLISFFIRPPETESKSPTWVSGDHPRLLATAAEKSAIIAKLTTPGTASHQIWNSFVASNFGGNFRTYADDAFLYWVTGDAAAGQRAVDAGQWWIDYFTNGIDPNGSSFNELWYNYQDLVLIYDFAYDLLSTIQQSDWRKYMAMQGAKCDAVGPGYTPGNINTLWMFCDYASAVQLEGETGAFTIIDENVFHGLPDTAEQLKYPINDSNFKISDTENSPTADYTEGIDYYYRYVPGCGLRCIDWSPSGGSTKEPGVGQTYYISYTFTPDIATWKSNARTAIEYHLNYQWHDGYYNGGLNPYGNLAAEQLPLFAEMLKRDTGIDISRDPDVKRIVDMYMYSKLPSTPSGVPRRFNTINDTGGWTNYDADAWTYPSPTYGNYKSWLRPFIAWGTSQYANDPEGYGQRYTWLWTQGYRNADGTIKYTPVADWREALWINNSAVTPYVDSTAVPTASWPKTRYFRGKEVIYARTDDWNTPEPQAALMSMVAGNHNYQNEHDQGDAGSFTFFSQNEDWGIDPGYGSGLAGYTLADHNTVGIDGHGFDVSGAYGVPDATSYFGGFSHFDDVALTSESSAMVADLTRAWTVTSTPYAQRDQRYISMINGSQPSYLVVADDFQKDASNHSYEWYLHTGSGNTLNINGNVATITGARAGATLDVYSLGPVTSTWTSSSSTAGNLGTHPVLKDTASATTDANFLHVLIPTPVGTTPPTITRTVVSAGIMAGVDWPDGTHDTILWRTAAGTISGGGATSDAKITIVRQAGGMVEGLVVVAGRSVTFGSVALLSVVDGSAPVTVSAFGATAGVYATDAAQVRIGMGGVTSATLEDGTVSIPVFNDGTTAYINGGLPLAEMRRGAGRRYDVDFDDNYTHDLFRFNISHNPAEQFAVVGGALELRPVSYEWPSFSRRDSTPWRRTGIFPTVIPPVDNGDGDYSFRYRFNGTLGTNAKFRVYLRTVDRNPVDWSINQDYVRLELNAVSGGVIKNEIILGQRVNGTWVTVSDNDLLTAALPVGTATVNDQNWHTVKVRLLGQAAEVWVDGASVVSGTLPTAVPTSGYAEWSVVGTVPVLLDNFLVEAIDQTNPVAPTDGTLHIFPDGHGTLTTIFGQGSSTDTQSLRLYESGSPIQPDDDPTGLTLVSSSSVLTGLAFSSADRNLYHAMDVRDVNGNTSPLVSLTVDITSPAAVTDLRAN